jgi:hypothetical protein
MRRLSVLLALCVALVAAPVSAKTVSISASPNPASVGDRVRHTVAVGASVGRLEIWVSARGFGQPGFGSLPPGTWRYECCPSQTAATPAWHYRSSTTVSPGSYAFTAAARARGTFLSTAAVAGGSSGVWIRIL